VLLKVTGIALIVLGALAVPLALLGAFGAAMDMDPPYQSAAPFLWVVAGGVASTLAGCLALHLSKRAKEQS
jgi:hypothetical protein